MSFLAVRITAADVDDTLLDGAAVGPELAAAAHAWIDTPRALLWKGASPDWPLLIVMLPLASRLSLMTNPIFGRLVRDWGVGIRFIGVDAQQSLFDFRDLLDARALRRLIDAIARTLTADEAGHQPGRGGGEGDQEATADAATDAGGDDGVFGSRGTGSTGGNAGDDTLDALFSVLADDMLTLLERRRSDWRLHLATEGRLIVDRPGADPAPGTRSLFDRRQRHPEFIAQLQGALRAQLIDVGLYGRILRSVDHREDAVETRLLAMIEGALDARTLSLLSRDRAGAHVGAYNWLLHDPRVAAHRAATLHKCPLLTQFLADRFAAGLVQAGRAQQRHRLALGPSPSGPDDGRPAADGERALARLARALDSGQDGAITVALAAYFDVSENTIRTLWRACPPALGAPPEWHLRQLLRTLDDRPTRSWPSDAPGWLALKSASVPAALIA